MISAISGISGMISEISGMISAGAEKIVTFSFGTQKLMDFRPGPKRSEAKQEKFLGANSPRLLSTLPHFHLAFPKFRIQKRKRHKFKIVRILSKNLFSFFLSKNLYKSLEKSVEVNNQLESFYNFQYYYFSNLINEHVSSTLLKYRRKLRIIKIRQEIDTFKHHAFELVLNKFISSLANQIVLREVR
jgi:hypothetical protein